MDLITGFTIGLIGSLHCLGMCGPIAIGIPLHNQNWFLRVMGGLLYNSGRIITYGVLGAIFGLLGRGIQLAGFQQWASIGIGIIMIVSVLFPVVFREKIKIDKVFSGYAGRLIDRFRTLFTKSSLGNLLFIGLLNGLLPCGLVYMAIAGAINTNSVVMGIAFMVMFGIGTTPVLLLLSLAGNIVTASFRRKASKVIPVFIVILGILFILRGMNLGIPYVSPKTHKLEVKQEMNTTEPCCH
ncbi:MAG: sulfite exporter TauE/SafE family protein [Bacteroidales bacterium]|nr:sulfite exporter TauE/SafE family protein [Bacteroidales bacterium]MCF8406158.1 sulfite exporter TauE/SafE family protein [Bacteroidales bacterium]